jgi:hypothetical protein
MLEHNCTVTVNIFRVCITLQKIPLFLYWYIIYLLLGNNQTAGGMVSDNFVVIETKSHCVAQAGLKLELLGSSAPPA